MPTYSDSSAHQRSHSDLVQAVRDDADLPDAEWDRLWKLATPQQRRVARMITDPTCAPHGEPSTYVNWGCRCEPCTASRRTAKVNRDFPAVDLNQPKPLTEMTPTEKALHMREQGFDLTPKALALIEAFESDANSVI